MQYAILFDRLLRFPITGPRMRNYDGLGGQLLFAYLHRHGHITWADNQLTIDWDSGRRRRARRSTPRSHELYRTGIDRSKLAHWCGRPRLRGPLRGAGRRVELDGGRTRASRTSRIRAPYIDLVLDDEFPLSIFYSQLKTKLGA